MVNNNYMEHKCNKCDGYTTVSGCCDEKINITKNGRIKCTKCNKFCKIADCTECPKEFFSVYNREDEELIEDNQVREHAVMVAVLIALFFCIVAVASYYKR